MQTKKLIGFLFILLFIHQLDGVQKRIPDITDPGPDTPSFPSSPFTVPQGVTYLENYPVYTGLPDNHNSTYYNWPFLLRVGLTNFLEFRATSQGLTVLGRDCAHPRITGFSPLAVGFKVHLWGSKENLFYPSGALEFLVITPIASQKFRDCTQIFVNTLFNIVFPHEWNLEWNIGVYSTSKITPCRSFLGFVNWALQKQVLPRLALYIENSYTTSKYPWQDSKLLLGFGFISYLNKRVAIYSSFDWSFFKSDQEVFEVGFAVAF